MNKIAMIGAGVYGIAMAQGLCQNELNQITMWVESEDAKKRIEDNRNAFQDLGGICIDPKISFTTSYQEALQDAEIVFIMCAARFVKSVCEGIKSYIKEGMHFVIGTKGIEQESCRFIHEIFLDCIPTTRLSVISGPTFAIDIANLEPVGLALASENEETIEAVQEIYKDTQIKLRATKDVLGVELCGAIKNVIALAAGILDGLGYKESTRSFLITESLHDIKALIDQLGGDKNTITSFAGVGDLLLTCTSIKSRNYSFGVLIGKKEDANILDEYISKNTVEGYYTLTSIYDLVSKRNIEAPIIELIYNVVIKKDNPSLLSEFLLNKK